MSANGHVLNVSRSVTGRAWRARAASDREALAIAQRHGVPELLGRVLAARRVELESVGGYLNPTLKELMPDPYVLAGMEEACSRIAQALASREQIGIIGDYDVDGIASTAMLASYLEAAGARPVLHIPDRLTEGYGPSREAIAALQAKNVRLLVTLDCGTTAHDALALAAEAGIETVVIDHHLADEVLPRAAALVNPNRQDDLSGLGNMCAAGLTLMLLAGLNRLLRKENPWQGGEPDLLASLDLAALGTVCDMVPLTGLNRALVLQGFKVMARRQRVGLASLADAARLGRAPDTYGAGFILGPRLNAAGRVGDAKLALRLLMTRDRGEAAVLAQELERLNRERQSVELRVIEEARAQAEAIFAREGAPPVIVVAGEGWHPGVLGLVASRLKERYGRPALAIGFQNGAALAAGSGRSVLGLDLGRAVKAAVEAGFAVKGGGHAMAAGLTVERARIGELGAFLAEVLATGMGGEPPTLEVDGALTASGATMELVQLLSRAGPYGSGNPEPVFVFPAHRVAFADSAGADHVRCAISAADGARLKAVAFRSLGTDLGELILSERRPLHVAGRLSLDDWNGKRQAQLLIEDAAAVPQP